MRRLALALTGALLLAGVLSCGGGPSGDKAKQKLRIAVIPKGTTHEFWKSIHAGAIKAEREEGVEAVWKGPLKEDERSEQIKVIEDFITQKVSGIVLAPLDDVALAKPVAEAKQAGIPVVIIDSGLKSQDYVSFVATDNRKGGRMAGEQLGKLLSGKGSVAMLRYAKGSASTEEREAGFLEAMAGFKDLKVVSENQEGGATTESAQKASETLLQRFTKPDGSLQLDGIFCPNESTTFGMLRALQGSKQAGKVKFVGFDASEKLVHALREGELHGLILQNPMKMGYLGVKTLVAHLRGQKVERVVDTGATLVTRENMDTPECKELLAPPLDKYLK